MTRKNLKYTTEHVKAIVEVQNKGQWNYTIRLIGDEKERKKGILEGYSNISVVNNRIYWRGKEVSEPFDIVSMVLDLNEILTTTFTSQEQKQKHRIKQFQHLGFEKVME